jgi:hypothetical protein
MENRATYSCPVFDSQNGVGRTAQSPPRTFYNQCEILYNTYQLAYN